MWISEQLLYQCAKALYKTEAAHTQEMKKAQSGSGEYATFRSRQIETILRACKGYGIDICDKIVLDMGCSDGAITPSYLKHGAKRVVGIDIDKEAIQSAQKNFGSNEVIFVQSSTDSIPVEDAVADVVICYDVFEHVSKPERMLEECYRVMRPGGKMLIGTWGWYHPFAPHLWATMPVPWAHVFFSERTVLRACRKVYLSDWYQPTMHDIDGSGRFVEGKYLGESISTDYLNKFLVKDFERTFRKSKFQVSVYPQHFSSKYARWTRFFLNTAWVREFITAYIWVVLIKTNDDE